MIVVKQKIAIEKSPSFKEKMPLFGYQIKEIKKTKKYIYFELIKENEDFNPYKISLEKEVLKEFKNPLPFFPLFIFLGIVIVLITTFLILSLSSATKDGKMTYFFSLCIPAFICLMGGTLYTYLRYKSIFSIMNSPKYSALEIETVIKERIKK